MIAEEESVLKESFCGYCWKANIALPGGTPPQSYRTSLPIWDHTVLPATRQVNAPRLSPTMPAGTRSTYPGGMEG